MQKSILNFSLFVIYLRFELALHIWTFDIYWASPSFCQGLPPAQLCFRQHKREYEITEIFFHYLKPAYCIITSEVYKLLTFSLINNALKWEEKLLRKNIWTAWLKHMCFLSRVVHQQWWWCHRQRCYRKGRHLSVFSVNVFSPTSRISKSADLFKQVFKL